MSVAGARRFEGARTLRTLRWPDDAGAVPGALDIVRVDPGDCGPGFEEWLATVRSTAIATKVLPARTEAPVPEAAHAEAAPLDAGVREVVAELVAASGYEDKAALAAACEAALVAAGL